MSRKKRRGSEPYDPASHTESRGEKKEKGVVKKTLSLIIVLLFLFVGVTLAYKMDLMTIVLSYFTTSEGREYRPYGEMKAVFEEARSLSAEEIKSREPIYAIETETYVSPKPDNALYDKKFENYTDKTIEVHYRSEIMYDSWIHFMEVRIKHPSQLRMALANDQFGSARKKPSAISSEVNAVAAVNGCFYNRRRLGVLIYKREVLRNKPFGVDVLLIDADADFHIVRDRKLTDSGVLDEYDIVSGISFGPELVRDGKALTITDLNWEPKTLEPRTAICQYDDALHYLVVLCEGRNARSKGVTMQTFANLVAAQGVRTAYNLDGGQSGTMVIGNRVKNRGGWGPEKPQSDILYFATGIDSSQTSPEA